VATTNRPLEGSHPHAHGHQCGQNDVIATPFCPSCPAAATSPSLHFHFSNPHTFQRVSDKWSTYGPRKGDMTI
jgi:hypothetical protein